jgi:enoyl-CoA hydratase/carnithine racemase
MAYSTIIVETIGPVARLTLSRPERANALTQAMLG